MQNKSIMTTKGRLKLLVQRFEERVDNYAAQAKDEMRLLLEEACSQGDIPTPQDVLHILEMGGGAKVLTVSTYDSVFGPAIALPGPEKTGWGDFPYTELNRAILVPQLGKYRLTIIAEPVQDGE